MEKSNKCIRPRIFDIVMAIVSVMTILMMRVC